MALNRARQSVTAEKAKKAARDVREIHTRYNEAESMMKISQSLFDELKTISQEKAKRHVSMAPSTDRFDT